MGNSLLRASKLDVLISKIKENIVFIIIYALILLFILWPIIAVVFNSIYVDGRFTLEAYSNLTFKSTKLLYNSFIVAFSSASIALIISTIIAIYVTFTKGHLKKFIMIVLLVSMISPPYVDSLSFIILFGKRGLITYKLLGLNINPYGFWGIVVMETLANIPRATLFIIMAMKSIDKNIIHASRDLGSDELSMLRSIILPISKHGLLSAFFISFVTSLSDFGTPLVIGGGFNVFATEAYLNITGVSDIPLASAMSIYLVIPSLIFFILYRKEMTRDQVYSYQIADLQQQDVENYIDLPKAINFIIKLITCMFLLIVVVKYTTILLGSFLSFTGGDVSFTLKHFEKIDFAKLSSFKRSIQYSLISGIVGSIIGILLSYGINRNKIFGKNFIDFVATLPYMMPGTLFGISYILAFKNPPLLLIGTSSIVILNCIFKQIPISSKAGAQVLKKINPEIENAAKDCGASNFHLLKDVILPLLSPAFLTSFINIFSSTMVTIGALIFLVSPGKEVATVQLFSAIKEGNLGVGSILANMIIFTTIIVNLSMSALLKGKFRRGESDVYGD
ncbi:iron ABC transporter permease [Soehngenia longivitae]|uniref:Iron ABC transporter permease n=1 Tax=Soehngenia longivitae TaxID=2562294 RepID=A0A4Z0D9W3_9FIRM|nr:iron ABC transporter permease [Soehngenia longivitae]TFZ41698.1 iron ABC transporter permease [Soehngenia longivitae]